MNRLLRLLAALTLGHLLTGAGAEPTDFAVVVHRDVPVTNLSMTDLRKVYLGDRQFWNSSTRIIPLLRTPVTRERAAVVWTICKMTEDDFNRHWIGKMMRAEATGSPRKFTTNPIAINLVTNMQGAIAIVNAAQVPAGEVKVVKVDGKLPGDADYVLRFED